jgi:acetyl esterase/lipase
MTVALAAACASAQVAPAATPHHRDLVFARVPTSAGPRDLALDLYLPSSSSGPLPCVVWIHGGAWRAGTRANPTCAHLVNYGFAVASIDYRLSDPAVGTWPAQLHDCKGAIRWLRANAATFGLDPDRFAVWGDSAGGHLAAMVGVTADVGLHRSGSVVMDMEGTTGGNLDQSSRVQAVVNWYGSTGFLSMSSFPGIVDHDAAGSPESQLLGAPIRLVPGLVALAEPETFLTRDDPPMVLRHGTHDTLVPFHQGEQLVRQARERLGLDYRLLPVWLGGHGSSAGFLPFEETLFLIAELRSPRPQVWIESLGGALQEGDRQPVVLRLHRAGDTTQELVVRLTCGGSASAGEDFQSPGAVVRFAAGSSFADLQLHGLDDSWVEGEEILRVTLCADPAYLVDADRASVAVNVVDDESAIGLPTVVTYALDRNASESGDQGIVQILRNGSVAQPLTVRIRVGGTATNGWDIDPIATEQTIPAGVDRVSLPVVPRADSDHESTEMVVVELLEGAGYVRSVLRSVDVNLHDLAPLAGLPLVSVTVPDPVVDEVGDCGAFCLTRTGDGAQPLTVQLGWSGRAQRGIDYDPILAPTTVTFLAGELLTFVSLCPLPDALVEGPESVVLRVLPGTGYLPGFRPVRELLLQDDEAPVPGTSDFRLEVDEVPAAGLAHFTMLDVAGGAPALLMLSVGVRLQSIPTANYPLLVDNVGLSLGPVMAAVLDAEGRAAVTLPMRLTAEMVGQRIGFQALSPSASGQLRASAMVRREISP